MPAGMTRLDGPRWRAASWTHDGMPSRDMCLYRVAGSRCWSCTCATHCEDKRRPGAATGKSAPSRGWGPRGAAPRVRERRHPPDFEATTRWEPVGNSRTARVSLGTLVPFLSMTAPMSNATLPRDRPKRWKAASVSLAASPSGGELSLNILGDAAFTELRTTMSAMVPAQRVSHSARCASHSRGVVQS